MMITKLTAKILAVCAFASVVSAHQAGAAMIVFQNGLNGYTGTQDAYISSAASQREKNYGTADRLILRAGSVPKNILLISILSLMIYALIQQPYLCINYGQPLTP